LKYLFTIRIFFEILGKFYLLARPCHMNDRY
jgi:hypothetical protein